MRTVLSAVMHYAAAMEYVESNPVMKVPPPPLPPSSRIAPTVEEAARILLEAESFDPEFLTYLWVAAEEGGRRGETLALRWAGVDFEASAITIDATVTAADDGVQVRPTTKTKKPRTIAVSSITLGLLSMCGRRSSTSWTRRGPARRRRIRTQRRSRRSTPRPDARLRCSTLGATIRA